MIGTFLPVNLLGGSLVFQYMGESLLLKGCISIFQVNIVLSTKTRMILTMSCLTQAFTNQNLLHGWTRTKVLLKAKVSLIQNLFLSLFIIKNKDVGSLGKRATLLASFNGFPQLRENCFTWEWCWLSAEDQLHLRISRQLLVFNILHIEKYVWL